jgi:serine phosphatase RsbU (regulator of sigma subunit)
LLSHAAAQIVTEPIVVNYMPLEYGKMLDNIPYLNNEQKLAIKTDLSGGWAVAQVENGKLYFGMTSGLWEFDGQTWDVIFLTTEMLSGNGNGNAVRSLHYDKNTQKLYVGGQNNFGYIETQKNGKQIFVSLYNKFKDFISKNVKRDIAEVWGIRVYKNEVFFQTRFATFIYNGKDLRIIHTKDSYHKMFLTEQKIFLRQDTIGLTKYENGAFIPVKFGETFAPAPNYHISGLVPYYKGGLLVGTRREGLFIYGEYGETKEEAINKKGISPELDAKLKEAQIYHIAVLADGSYGIATLRGGIFILDKDLKLVRNLTEADGLHTNSILYLFQDKDENLWFTSFKGIGKITLKTNFKYFDATDGLNTNFKDIQKFKGEFYGIGNTGVYKFDEKTQRFEHLRGVLGQGFAMQVMELEGEERLIVASDNLYEIKSNQAVPLLKIAGRIVFTYLFKLSKEKDIIRVLMNDGRSAKILYKGGKAEIIGTFDIPREILGGFRGFDEAENAFIATTSDTTGKLLIYYDFYQEKIIKTFTRKDFEHFKNVPAEKDKKGFPRMGTTKDFDGNIILGINYQHYKWDSKTLTFVYLPRYNQKYNLPDSTDINFAQMNNKAFALFSNLKNNDWSIYIYKNAQGGLERDSMPMKFFFENGYNFRYTDENFDMWLTGPESAYRFDGKIKMKYNHHFPTYIKSIRPLKNTDSLFVYNVFGKSTETYWTLPFSQNGLRFEFSAVDLTNKEKVKYRYWLQGQDTQWSEWSVETYKDFTNLPEGTYTLHVQAQNFYGFVGETASFTFRILAPWYRTWWTYLAYLVVGALLFIVLVRLNSRRLRKYNEYLGQLVTERTREIDMQKEEILAQAEELRQSNDEIMAQKEEMMAQRDALEQKNHEVMDSIAYGSRIQTAILPFNERIEKTLDEYFVLFQPRDVVSGDFYWFHDTNPSEAMAGKAIIVVADCTGHGVPGAFMSMIGNQILYEIVIQMHILEPDLILNTLHKEIRRTLRQYETDNRDGMDIGIVVWDKAIRSLEFSGARNNLVYFVNNQMQIIKGDKKAIGGEQREEERIFTKNTISLPAHHEPFTFYLHTDGFPDQFGGIENKKFGIQRMRELLASIQGQSMSEQEYTLLHTITQWKNDGRERQTDDILVWGVKV